MNLWQLPVSARIGGREYPIHADYRDILGIIDYLNDASRPEFLRWQIALALFYEKELPQEDWQEGMNYLASFLSCGQKSAPGPKLLDWNQDAQAIIADVNKVAGREIRGEGFVHWWTFLSWFHGIGEGQLSTLVSIRDKLRRGKKLELWEQEYYRKNKERVDLKKQYSPEDIAQQEKLQKLLGE